MNKKISISDSELEVMKELWATPGINAKQLSEKLTAKTSWSEPTVKTLLLRLLQKNAVMRVRKDNLFVYSACISQEEYRCMAGRSLMNRLFNGVAGDLITCLVRNEKMSAEEIESLKKLLDEAAEK